MKTFERFIYEQYARYRNPENTLHYYLDLITDEEIMALRKAARDEPLRFDHGWFSFAVRSSFF